MDIQSEKERCERAEEQIKAERAIIAASKQAVADHDCPFEVGETVLNPDGEKEVIARIFFRGWNGKYRPRYEFTIFKIKKNGEKYVNDMKAYYPEEYTKID